MKTLRNLFNIIEKNSINNKCTITNVDLFLKSWKRDMNNELYLENEKLKEIEEYCKRQLERKVNK
jgi:hypothetical protein